MTVDASVPTLARSMLSSKAILRKNKKKKKKFGSKKMNLLAKAKEGASAGVAGIGSLSSLGASSLGGLTSSAVSFGSAAVGHLQVGGRAAAATKLVKDLVLTPKSTLITGSLPSALVPDERVDYAIVLPPAHRGQEDDGDAYPLLLTLHGLKGSRDGLVKQHEHGDWDARFTAGVCPQMVVATISGGDNYYMDFHDKSAMWETFLVEVHSQRLARRFSYEMYSTHVHLTILHDRNSSRFSSAHATAAPLASSGTLWAVLWEASAP